MNCWSYAIVLSFFFFLCDKVFAITTPPPNLYTYGETISNIFSRVIFFFGEWITHEITHPGTSNFATSRENWPPQNNMILYTNRLISTDEYR